MSIEKCKTSHIAHEEDTLAGKTSLLIRGGEVVTMKCT